MWALAHMGPGPYGPWPIWALAHMGLGPYGPWPIWALAHMGLGPLPLTVRLTVPNCFTAYPRGNYKHVWTDSTQTLADATFPETHCLEPTGPRPIWAKAHMGQGPYGPGPILWARAHMGQGPYEPRAHMGQGPYGPRAPGPRALPCWANTSPENAPKKMFELCYFLKILRT